MSFDRFPMGSALHRAVLICLLGLSQQGRAQDARTPRAGEAFTGRAFGIAIDVPARDRRSVTELYAGLQWAPDGPEEKELSPEGALLLWRNRDGGGERLRAVLLGIYDDVRYNHRLAQGDLEAVLTFENTTLPWAQADYAQGQRLRDEELASYSVRAGAGIGFRRALAPGRQDNALEAAFTYEPGLLVFRRAGEAVAELTVPGDAYEGRFHVRARLDTLERNLLELPHAGFAAGLDAVAAHRSGWQDWGGGPSGAHPASEGRSWSALSGYALAALPAPGIRGERLRILLSAYGGTGSDLDRFSAFRLSGGSNAGDFETLSRPVLPGAAFDEIDTRGYVIANAELRYEAAFFLFPFVRGTVARVDRQRMGDSGAPARRTDSLNALTIGLTSGFLWDSAIEIFLSRNSGLEKREGDAFVPGRNTLFVSFTKAF